MKLKPAILALAAVSVGSVQAQTNNYFGTTGALTDSVWSTNPSGPYTNALVTTGGAIINFGNAASFSGGSITVAGINATENASLSGPSDGTISLTGFIDVNVASGKTLNLGLQQFTTTSGRGLAKIGDGVLALGATSGDLSGGFTMSAGTVVVLGVNGLGNGTLIMNGGIVASNGNLDFGTRHGGGISIGGNLQFGELSTVVSLANSSANLSFANNVSLGGATRTLTIGNNGSNTFSGLISGDVGAGLTIASASGVNGNFTFGGINSYSGPTTIRGGTLVLNSTGTIADSPSIVVGDAGSSGASLNTTAKSGFTISGTQSLSGIGSVNVGSGKTLTIEGTHSVGNVGMSGGIGTQTVTGNLNYTGSIFNWDLNPSVSGPDPGIVANNGAYDKVTATGTITGTSSAFNVVLGESKSFTDAFWNTDKSWADVFTGSSAPSLASIFTTFGGSGVAIDGIVAGQGQFGFTNSTLNWTAVPEPTSALAGLMLTAGLLRRRRVA